jgi:hypothetical protein
MRTLLITLCLFGCALAQAQWTPMALKKVAIVSLVGDEMAVDVYRRRVGTSIDSNDREVVPIDSPIFDHAALLAAAQAAGRAQPAASFAPLSVPKPGSAFDPNTLFDDKGTLVGRAAVDVLRQQGFDHLLTVSKFRGQARMQLMHQTIGSGYVQGLGFYVDNFLQTQRTDTGEIGRGFIAPYAYLMLRLVDLNTGAVVRSSTVTASAAQSAARNKDGVGAWGALTSGEKIGMLRGLIQEHVADEVAALLR